MTTSDLLIEFLPAVANMTLILLAGYLSSRSGLVTPQNVIGMSRFVSSFCLPSMLFNTLATLNFQTVNYVFVLSIFLSKSAVFLVVVLVTLLLDLRLRGRPQRFMEAGLRGILATQSNDFALGLPILKVVYSISNPTFPLLLYVIAPISCVIINPIAFCLMEYGYAMLPVSTPCPTLLAATVNSTRGLTPGGAGGAAATGPPSPSSPPSSPPILATIGLSTSPTSLRAASTTSDASLPPTAYSANLGLLEDGNGRTAPNSSSSSFPATSATTTATTNTKLPVKAIFLSVIKNPVVMMTFLGLCWNILFRGWLPPFVKDILGSFAGVFPVSAIFIMGVNMAKTLDLQQPPDEDLSTYALIVLGKLLLLPTVSYFLVVLLGGSADLATLAFIVGALPVAPTVSIYALRYSSPEKNYVAQLSAATVLSTVVGVPILIVMVIAITVVQDPTSDLPALINMSVQYLTLPGALGSTWLLASFSYAKRNLQTPFRDLYLCIIFSTLRGWLVFLCSILPLSQASALTLNALVGLLLFCTFTQRIWFVILSITTWLRRAFGPDHTTKLRLRIYLTAVAFLLLLSFISWGLLASAPSSPPAELVAAPLLLSRLRLVALFFSFPCLLLTTIFLCLHVGLKPHALARQVSRRFSVLSISTRIGRAASTNLATTVTGTTAAYSSSICSVSFPASANVCNGESIDQVEGGAAAAGGSRLRSMSKSIGRRAGEEGRMRRATSFYHKEMAGPPRPADVVGLRTTLFLAATLFSLLLTLLRCALEDQHHRINARLLTFLDAGIDVLQPTALFLIWGLEKRQKLAQLLGKLRHHLLIPAEYFYLPTWLQKASLQSASFHMPSLDLLHALHLTPSYPCSTQYQQREEAEEEEEEEEKEGEDGEEGDFGPASPDVLPHHHPVIVTGSGVPVKRKRAPSMASHLEEQEGEEEEEGRENVDLSRSRSASVTIIEKEGNR